MAPSLFYVNPEFRDPFVPHTNAGLLHSKKEPSLFENYTMEAPKNIVEFFEKIPEHRRGVGKRHCQVFILMITLMSTMSKCYGYRAIGDFIKRNESNLLEHVSQKKTGCQVLIR